MSIRLPAWAWRKLYSNHSRSSALVVLAEPLDAAAFRVGDLVSVGNMQNCIVSRIDISGASIWIVRATLWNRFRYRFVAKWLGF